MRLRKITVLVCIAAMLASAISAPVAATEATQKYLLINDQFGDGDVGGWVQHKNSDTTYCSFGTERIEGNNYALAYESTGAWAYDYIKREIPGGITLTTGVDVVLEARIKQTGSGRSYIKYNLDENIVANHNQQEWNFQWGTLIYNNGGKIQVLKGYKSYASTAVPGKYIYNYPTGFMGSENNTFVTNALGAWYTYKVIIHGSTGGTANKASYYMYDNSGTVVKSLENVSIDFPDNSSWANSASTAIQVENISWTEDVINDFAIRFRDSGKILVDYFKVWQQGIEVTSTEVTADMRNINVKINSNGVIPGTITDYINLYESDGVTPAEFEKSYDAKTSTVTFTSQEELVAGAVYKVKFDKTGIQTDMLYVWEAEEEVSIEAPACAALNLTIKGVLAPGTVLEADYDVIPEGSVESGSEYVWYTVDDNGEKSAVGGADGKYFEVTEDYVDSVITYSVKPVCLVGGEEKPGVFTNCDKTVKPLSCPVASNPRFSSTGAMIGESLTAVYDYADADGDEESGSVITWYAGSSAEADDYTEFATGKTINIGQELNGKYLKFTVKPANEAIFRGEGELLGSGVIGPVADIITASNLLVNPGLEDGVLSPWTFNAREGYLGVTLVDEPEGVYEGSYAMRAHPRVSLTDAFSQSVRADSNKMYIVSGMVKSATTDTWSNYEGYVSGSFYRPYRSMQYTTVTPDEWTRVSLTFLTTAPGTVGVGFIYWGAGYSADVYIDNVYFGELRISDIGTKEVKPVTIPRGDETVLMSVLDGKVYNQFGETDGLTEQKIVLSAGDAEGITVSGNDIIIDSGAVAGTYTLTATVIPEFRYNIAGEGEAPEYAEAIPAQSEFTKEIQIELLAHNDKAPAVSNVNASGTVATGNVLTGSYDFYQVEGKADMSEIRWMYSDSEDGTYYPIPGATALSYTVVQEYADKYIKFEVTAVADDGARGAAVLSEPLTKPTAPYATDLKVSGDFKVGGTIEGSYKYCDDNKDEEGVSTYKWYAAETKNGNYTQIPGAEGQTLVLTQELVGKYIKFGVSPVAVNAPVNGDEVFSSAYTGPVAPVARDVSITAEGNRLTGNYTYYHEHNARELNSIYKWTVDGITVSTTSNYVMDFTGTKTVTFTVTPVADTNPGMGESVSVSVVINNTNGNTAGNTPVGGIVSGGGSSGGGASGGGSSGGGSSGGGIASGVTSINDLDYGKETASDSGNTEPVQSSDLDNHWGAEYIKNMEAIGVMGADGDGKYKPDEYVTREEMLTYLFKTLKLEKSDYSGMFGDVPDGEFAQMLQTMVDNGTISADSTFRPGDTITREEMCKILCISLKNAGVSVDRSENTAAVFADYDSISDWALEYVNVIYGIRMMIGVSDERFAPGENVTKAQAATMLTRMISWVEGE